MAGVLSVEVMSSMRRASTSRRVEFVQQGGAHAPSEAVRVHGQAVDVDEITVPSVAEDADHAVGVQCAEDLQVEPHHRGDVLMQAGHAVVAGQAGLDCVAGPLHLDDLLGHRLGSVVEENDVDQSMSHLAVWTCWGTAWSSWNAHATVWANAHPRARSRSSRSASHARSRR